MVQEAENTLAFSSASHIAIAIAIVIVIAIILHIGLELRWSCYLPITAKVYARGEEHFAHLVET